MQKIGKFERNKNANFLAGISFVFTTNLVIRKYSRLHNFPDAILPL